MPGSYSPFARRAYALPPARGYKPPTPSKGGGDIIRSIFADGTDGFYFDFSKTDRLFQASTPQAAADDAGESIAYALEAHGWAGQSFPGVVAEQAEKVSNGDFSGGTTGWVSGSSFTSTAAVVSGEMQVTPTVDFGRQYQTVTTVAGRAYRVTGRGRQVSGPANPYVVINRSGNQGDDIIAQYFSTTSLTNFSSVFVATGTSPKILLSSRAGVVAGFDDISVKEVPGNHGLQLTAAAQPKWQSGGVVRGDGSDDHLLTTLMPALAFTMMFKANLTSGSKSIMGSAGVGGNNRCFVGLNASGFFGAGVGAESYGTVNDGVDARGQTFVGAVTLDGTTVKLYKNGAQVYSDAQSSTPTTAVALALLAVNGNGTPSNFADADVAYALAIKKALTAAEIAAITNLWGTS